VSDASGDPRASERQQGIAAAITEVSERATLLIREEIELAKTEITEKTTRLAKGAVVAVVAGVFFLTALFFVLIGCAWLLYYELPIGNQFTYFWGFFAMALILVLLGALAGILAAKAVKSGSPPVPAMAIEEARKIRETVSSGSEPSEKADKSVAKPVTQAPASTSPPVAGGTAQSAGTRAPASKGASAVSAPPQVPVPAAEPVADPATPASTSKQHDSQLGRETDDGSTLGR
jgi:hypothetical protein